MAKSFHNIERRKLIGAAPKDPLYIGYGNDGHKYSISVYVTNRNSIMHYRALPMHKANTTKYPNPIYGRTLKEISKKLEELE